MESIRNFRELGHLPVATGAIRPGLLFRSGHLGAASDGDLHRLAKLGIRTIIDLRSDSDIAMEGHDRIPDGAAHHRIPVVEDFGRDLDLRELITAGKIDDLRSLLGQGRGHEIALEGAVAFVIKSTRDAAFARALRVISDPDNWPILWHCSAGKDRAGWVGTSVLLAAGAAPSTIVEHYLQSNVHSGAAAMFPDGELKDLLRPFLEVHEAYVQAQLLNVRSHWGGIDELYRDGFGISTAELTRFQNALVATR